MNVNETTETVSETENLNKAEQIVTDNDNPKDEETEDYQEEEEEENESDYEYTYDDDDAVCFLTEPPNHEQEEADNNNNITNNISHSSSATAVVDEIITTDQSTTSSNNVQMIQEDATTTTTTATASSKWKEPSRAAVNMSLRAEKETSGGRRRLAQDLYKIMLRDTHEKGFEIEPSNEDSMDKWRIHLFDFDQDSKLAQDLKLLNLKSVELEMSFPEQYPFEPPFVRVVRPKFKRQTGFVMNGALCMELLTSDGWNPINDIESVIVSIRSLLVVGDGRLEAAETVRRQQQQESSSSSSKKQTKSNSNEQVNNNHNNDSEAGSSSTSSKRAAADYLSLHEAAGADEEDDKKKSTSKRGSEKLKKKSKKEEEIDYGSYTASEARAAYSHLSAYHKKKGWDQSGFWSKKG